MSEHNEPQEHAENGHSADADQSGTLKGGGVDIFTASTARNHTKAMNIIGRLFDIASPRAVFGEPITAGDHTIITASEVSVGMGLGFGGGGGESARSATQMPEAKDLGGGAGGGGGGASSARPVAAIIIGPAGVRVEPIFDITKVGIAFITALGAIFMARRAMRRASVKPGVIRTDS